MPSPLLLHSYHAPDVTYQAYGGWIVPWRFESTAAEYQRLRRTCGVLDASFQAVIEVRGSDRTEFLQGQLTNDVAALVPGTGAHAALLDVSAKLLAELYVVADRDVLWLWCDAHRTDAVTATLEGHHFNEDVTINNLERAQGALTLQGPEALTRLAGLTDAAAIPTATDTHTQAELGPYSLRLIRRALPGGDGVVLVSPAAKLRALWDFLRAEGVQPVGWEALHIARVEAGIPWFGIDMDEANLLSETGLQKTTVSDTKGCYTGQEIVARMATYGSASKRLMGLAIRGDAVPESGDAIVNDAQVLGRVTSACYSPALKHPIGLGYVKRGAYEPGTRVTILRGEKRLSATVSSLPLVPPPPSNERPASNDDAQSSP